MEITGQQLLDALEWGAKAVPHEFAAFLAGLGPGVLRSVPISKAAAGQTKAAGLPAWGRIPGQERHGRRRAPGVDKTHTIAAVGYLAAGSRKRLHHVWRAARYSCSPGTQTLIPWPPTPGMSSRGVVGDSHQRPTARGASWPSRNRTGKPARPIPAESKEIHRRPIKSPVGNLCRLLSCFIFPADAHLAGVQLTLPSGSRPYEEQVPEQEIRRVPVFAGGENLGSPCLARRSAVCMPQIQPALPAFPHIPQACPGCPARRQRSSGIRRCRRRRRRMLLSPSGKVAPRGRGC